MSGVAAASLEAIGWFACPSCGAAAGDACTSLANKPQDAAGRWHADPFPLDLCHPKRMALRRAHSVLSAAGLTPSDFARLYAGHD